MFATLQTTKNHSIHDIGNDQPNTTYHFDFKHFKQHLVEVTLTFTAVADSPTLWLPTWIPGSYLIREFARNITAVSYQKAKANSEQGTLESNNSGEGKSRPSKTSYLNNPSNAWQRARKSSKNEWQLDTVQAKETVTVHYEVYCYDLSVRTAYVDQTRLYGNFTSLALAVEGIEHQPVQALFYVPQAFYDLNTHPEEIKFVCGLPVTHLHNDDQHQFSLQTTSYEELIDFPFEISAQDEFSFIVQVAQNDTLVHRFYISGKHKANTGRLQQDVTHICQTYVNWLGDAPFGSEIDKGYSFMTYASGNDYGGLEHINSTSLVTPRSDLPAINEPDEPSEGYQRFLGLCSHEYFHAWWVKTVRPDVMMDVDLRKEAYTPLLWVFEGFTSYIDDFMLQASGVISHESYLKLLAAQINRYIQTHGRYLQSVAESSFDAWIKLYRADENTGNAGISYYNKGALVALCLDLTLKQKSNGKYRLFDVVKAFYEKAKAEHSSSKRIRIGMTDTNLGEVICQFMDRVEWERFKALYVDGVAELPLETLLKDNGVSFELDSKDNVLPWGISFSEVSEGLKVNKVLRDSVASEAGISAKDMIVAIDGVKASKKQLHLAAEFNVGLVQCHAFRRDELMTFNVAHKTASGITANPSLEKVALTFEASGFESWLNPDFIRLFSK